MAKFKMTGGKDAHDSLEPLRTSFKAGSVVFEEGDLGLAMYVIESGEVEIRKRLGRKSEILAVLGKGDFFGEMCMLEDEVPRSATALAKTDLDAVMIDRSAFTFILKHNPEITIRIMRKLVRRLRQTTEMLEEALGHAVDLEGPGAADGPKGPPDPRARLVEVTTGLAFPLAKEGETTVGRIDPVTGIHPDIDLTPVDGKRSISRRHARLHREADGTFTVVEDVGTMNGTFVNGTRVSAGKPHPVEPGDTVMFGTIQCRFEIDPSQA
ncbi:MAG TPA: cyclic nucleotide-binding domain-containing protein [Methylomirabilota bacterium]|nr:cyclic nucleotide-binding domain-containing protein [Methylomirabilota bacterium]